MSTEQNVVQDPNILSSMKQTALANHNRAWSTLRRLHTYVSTGGSERALSFLDRSGITLGTELHANTHSVFANNDQIAPHETRRSQDIHMDMNVTFETLREKTYFAIRHFASLCSTGDVMVKADDDVVLNYAGISALFEPPSNALLLATDAIVYAGTQRGGYHYLKTSKPKHRDQEYYSLTGRKIVNPYMHGQTCMMSCKCAVFVATQGLLPLVLDDAAVGYAVLKNNDAVWINIGSKVIIVRAENNCYERDWISLHDRDHKYTKSQAKRQCCHALGHSTLSTEFPVYTKPSAIHKRRQYQGCTTGTSHKAELPPKDAMRLQRSSSKTETLERKEPIEAMTHHEQLATLLIAQGNISQSTNLAFQTTIPHQQGRGVA